MKDTSDQADDAGYLRYVEQHQRLLNYIENQWNKHDQAILTLSVAILSASLIFYREIVPDTGVKAPTFLIISWIGQCLAVSTIVFATAYGAILAHREKDRLYNSHSGSEDPLQNGLETNKRSTNHLHEREKRIAKIFIALNLSSNISFVVSLISLTAFAAVNINFQTGSHPMNEVPIITMQSQRDSSGPNGRPPAPPPTAPAPGIPTGPTPKE